MLLLSRSSLFDWLNSTEYKYYLESLIHYSSLSTLNRQAVKYEWRVVHMADSSAIISRPQPKLCRMEQLILPLNLLKLYASIQRRLSNCLLHLNSFSRPGKPSAVNVWLENEILNSVEERSVLRCYDDQVCSSYSLGHRNLKPSL